MCSCCRSHVLCHSWSQHAETGLTKAWPSHRLLAVWDKRVGSPSCQGTVWHERVPAPSTRPQTVAESNCLGMMVGDSTKGPGWGCPGDLGLTALLAAFCPQPAPGSTASNGHGSPAGPPFLVCALPPAVIQKWPTGGSVWSQRGHQKASSKETTRKRPAAVKWHQPGSGYQQEHGDASWKPGDRVPRTKPPAEATARSLGLTPGLPWEDGSPKWSMAPCHHLRPPQDRQHSPSSPSHAPLHTQTHFSFSYFFVLVIYFSPLSHSPCNAEKGCWLQKRQLDSSNRSSSLILTVTETPAAAEIRGSIHICQL